MKKDVVSITELGRSGYDDYKETSLHRAILVVLYREPKTMLELLEAVRQHKDSFRFMQPKAVIKAIVELQTQEYVRNTYQ